MDNSSDPFLQDVAVQIHERFGDDYAGAWQIMPDVSVVEEKSSLTVIELE